MNNPFDMFRLTGRKALITGSSRGIGAAMAIAMAQAGADVAIHYTSNKDSVSDVANKIREIGRQAIIIQADLSKDKSAEKIIDEANLKLGGIDILVINASIQIPEPWNEVNREHIDRQMAVNWRSSFELIQFAAPMMLEKEWGRILTIGSVQERCPHPDMVIYSSLKAAQTLMVKNFAKQFAAKGVTVNNLAPGVINTDRSKERLVDEDYKAKVLAKIPVGYIGVADDCVGAALLLCSDAGRYITGQSLFVDGGMSI